MESKYLLSPAIITLIMVCCSGCGTFIGTTIKTTVNPDFDVKKYHEYYIYTGDEMSFFDTNRSNDFFENNKFDRIYEGVHVPVSGV